MNARQSVIIAMFLTMTVYLLANANASTIGGSISRNLTRRSTVPTDQRPQGSTRLG